MPDDIEERIERKRQALLQKEIERRLANVCGELRSLVDLENKSEAQSVVLQLVWSTADAALDVLAQHHARSGSFNGLGDQIAGRFSHLDIDSVRAVRELRETFDWDEIEALLEAHVEIEAGETHSREDILDEFDIDLDDEW